MVVALLVAGVASAQAPDGDAPASDRQITNRAVIEFGPDEGALSTIEAETTISVVAPDVPGELSAWRVSGDEADTLGQEIVSPEYSPSGDADGPFVPVPERTGGAGAAAGLSPTERVRPDEDVVFVLVDPLENTDTGRRDSATLEVTDSVSGDTEMLRIYETGEDTGTFVGGICACSDTEAGRDGVLATQENSRVLAAAETRRFPERRFESSVTVGPVTPRGRVFDSRSGTPLNGARITIIDAETGAPADVFGADLESAFPATVESGGRVTDASGQGYDFDPGAYRFPYVEPGQYVFLVTPPEGYVAPSSRRPEEVAPPPGDDPEVNGASYLEPFAIASGETLIYDIPLDGAALLDVTRTGSADRLSPGEAIRYTATVGGSVPGRVMVNVTDMVPEGLKRVEGSLRIDGERPGIPVVRSRNGRSLRIEDLVLPEGERRRITYVARVTVAAPERGVLTSRTTVGGEDFAPASAIHGLEIGPAFGRDESAVLGQVQLGCGPSAGPPERDLSGIRVMLENGRYAETDARGRFTLRRVPRGGHVLALDRFTLPRGFAPILCRNNTRRAGAAGSVFVESRDGFVRRVSFNLAEVPVAETPDPDVPDTGTVSDHDEDWLNAAPRRAGLHFPPPGHLPPTRSLSAVVVRANGQTAKLFLNGEPVPELYKRPAVSSEGGARFLDIWRGAELEYGANRLRLVIRDADDAIVREETRTIRFNDRVESLEVVEEMSDLTTDGRSRPLVVFRAADADGTPLHPGAIVTVSVARPFAFAPGERLNDTREGAEPLQRTSATVDADGRFRMRLAPSRRSGIARFSVLDGETETTATAPISAAGRDWTAVGLVEGRVAAEQVAEAVATPGDSRLLTFGDVAVDGHAAVYLEGITPQGWNLTMRYDSAIDPDERDFFAEDPDRDYLVYGDESREGDAASSRSPLYFRLERGGTDLLWGDFETGIGDGRLADYTRSLTGARAIFEGDRQRLQLFAAEASLAFAEDEFPADGTSGPFDLSQSDILPNSETVVVETTARDDPLRVISRRDLRAGRDYSIDYVDGRLFLSEPLRARTADFDRNTLIVTYETDAARRDGVILGGRYDALPTERLRTGATLVYEDDIAGSDGAGQLFAVDGTYAVSEVLTARAEFAFSRQSASNLLDAARTTHAAEVSLTYEDGADLVEGYVRSQSTGFGIENLGEDPQTINVAALRASLVVSDDSTEDEDGTVHRNVLRFEGTARSERNVETGESLNIADAMLIREHDRRTRGAGLRFAARDDAPDQPDGRTLKGVVSDSYESADGRLRLSLAQEFTLWEEGDVAESDLGSLAVAYDASERLTLSATNEIAIGEDFRVDIASFGADYVAWPGATLSGGLVNVATGENSQTVGYLGFDQQLEFGEAISAYAGIEAQGALAGDLAETGPAARGRLTNPRLSDGFTTYSAGIQRVSDGWLGSVDTELGFTEESDHARLQTRATTPLTGDLSVGAYSSFFWADEHGGPVEQDHEIKLSAAWRPFDRPIVLLEQLEAIREADGETDELRIVNSLFYTRELEDRAELSLRHGLKRVVQDLDGDRVSDVLTLVGAEYRRDLTDWVDIGVHGASIWSLDGGGQRNSAGMSLGVTPFENGWVSLGYNVVGFRDRDFSESGYTDQGAFIQFRFKIDQGSFNEVF
ncbi:carboxypeptidase-like regulatory domain-containing protein [Tranquillimonas rosea]|uniref:carboxypeptidase-like regulatory domain-containing protein n=1 Tax=Tranquillimonas rosea TaxID=641238 RepID=UPI003BA9C77C